MSTQDLPPSPRTRIRRVAERGHYDADNIRRIIDAAWHCHVAFIDESSVHCIPTACWRHGDLLYIHGSNGSRMLKALAGGEQICVSITHLDGLVLARSAFNHSMNYRSAVIYGQCERVADEDKPDVLDYFMRRIAAGREFEVRRPNRNELAATLLLQLSLAEAVAKIREGGPNDDEVDLSHPVWSGVLPFRLQPLPAVQDPACTVSAPNYVQDWSSAKD